MKKLYSDAKDWKAYLARALPVAWLLLGGMIVTSAANYFAGSPAVVAHVVNKYCESVPAKERMALRLAVNARTAPNKVEITCDK